MNDRAIKFLVNQDDDACVLIFTRADADTVTSDERKVTNDEWRAIVRDFDKHFLDGDIWEMFGSIVNRNLNEKEDR